MIRRRVSCALELRKMARRLRPPLTGSCASAVPGSPGSTYSYISKPPPADNNVTIVRPAPRDWRPSPGSSGGTAPRL